MAVTTNSLRRHDWSSYRKSIEEQVTLISHFIVSVRRVCTMDTSNDDDFQAVEALYTLDYITISLAAFAIYEHLLTLDREVRLVWRRPVNIASVVVFANRYVALAYVLCGLATLDSNASCQSGFAETIITQVCYLVLTTIFALFAALRVYAIWDHSRLLFVSTAMVGLIPVVTNFCVLVSFKEIYTPGVVCEIVSRISPVITDRLAVATRISSVSLDAVVLFLTWMRVSVSWRTFRGQGPPRIGDVLFRNGCLCFVILLLLNTVEIVVFQVTSQTYITYFITITASILVSRFVMDLLDVHEHDDAPCAVHQDWCDATQTIAVSGLSSMVSALGQDFSHAPTLNERGGSFGPIDF